MVVLNTNSTEAIDLKLMTTHDKYQHRNGRPPQYYQGYMLFVDKDVKIAMKLKKALEDKGATICTKWDLLGGLTIEHVAVRTLISQRCHFLIVVLTQAFFDDGINEYFVNIGELIALTNKKRKIIPCIFETTLKLPTSIRMYVALRYKQSEQQLNAQFYSQLEKAIEPAKKALNIIEDSNLYLSPSPHQKKKKWEKFKKIKNRFICATSIENSV